MPLRIAARILARIELLAAQPRPPGCAPHAMPDDVVRDFDQALRELAEGVFGQARQASISHNRSRLSEAQAAEFSQRLLALIEEYFPPGKATRPGSSTASTPCSHPSTCTPSTGNGPCLRIARACTRPSVPFALPSAGDAGAMRTVTEEPVFRAVFTGRL